MKAKGLVTDKDYGWFFSSFFGPRRYEVQVPYEFLQVDELIDFIKKNSMKSEKRPQKTY